ncbi:hypothetical protein G6321_00002495 (plasmid) [Bradyrhizobium barranii subsp. barranii]|uniref:Uncharacterized protein n=1 Tax=Bradyrhizobium barranii subsp. barranii TaxID=2823807 RepID=A0A7Z0QN18_9BRAD|nr:hypothetical protein [Bradyrhizobium barranii]UGX89619.1 hypothetical protein G6321_00002495 [Bradyrhizobium barranii subsp. barranii]
MAGTPKHGNRVGLQSCLAKPSDKLHLRLVAEIEKCSTKRRHFEERCDFIIDGERHFDNTFLSASNAS